MAKPRALQRYALQTSLSKALQHKMLAKCDASAWTFREMVQKAGSIGNSAAQRYFNVIPLLSIQFQVFLFWDKIKAKVLYLRKDIKRPCTKAFILDRMTMSQLQPTYQQIQLRNCQYIISWIVWLSDSSGREVQANVLRRGR